MDTPLRMAAAAAHELFVELMRAGFTRAEALTLVGTMITSAMAQEQDKTGGIKGD